MICEICKSNQATIHIQEIIDGEKKVIHLCSSCAAGKSGNIPNIGGFNIAEMLYNLSQQMSIPSLPVEAKPEAASGVNPAGELICRNCGWNGEKFRETGRLGCPECYKVFGTILQEALENMHRGRLHVGKKPGGDRKERSPNLMLELMNLQKGLDETIQREEYEKAATIRDRITELKKKMKRKPLKRTPHDGK